MTRETKPAPRSIGTAGWTIPAIHAAHVPAEGSHLARYAARLDAVEINSSFYRPHRHTTYARWADSVPDAFRFAVKLPKTITHERKLIDCDTLLDRFLDETEGLGSKRGALLVQLPPSLAFDESTADRFFAGLRERTGVSIACEPRHRDWFTEPADALLATHRVARVAADPAPVPGAAEPGGWGGLVYRRLHGSPRIYSSDYDAAALDAIAADLASRTVAAWCIFDNTAAGHALGNALAITAMLKPGRCPRGGGSRPRRSA